jgi:hypothetical protein
MRNGVFCAVRAEMSVSGVSHSVRKLLKFNCCELLLEAGSWRREQFRNIEEGERPSLEAATKLMDTTFCV